MRKIPTLFVRDPQDMRYVTREVHPDCKWVLDGEGVATRKYDGTCVMFDGERWWARREVKPGKQPPAGFVQADYDEVTGKTVGWEPVEQSGYARWHAEAVEHMESRGTDSWLTGTYELCGPKVNGNPERFDCHHLIRHDDAESILVPAQLDFRTCERTVRDLAEHGYEGIVWHHPDGRMAKLKRRDFPRGGSK